MSAEIYPFPVPEPEPQPVEDLSPASQAAQDTRELILLANDFPEESEERRSLSGQANRRFHDFVELTSDYVRGAIRTFGASVEDHEEIFQETYLRAYRGLERFEGRSDVKTWIYRIALNAGNTYYLRLRRRESRQEFFSSLPDNFDAIDTAASPEERSEQEAEREKLQEALRSIPPRLRAVIVLRDVYDLPHEQIAEQLGISPNASKTRLHRARRQLREMLYPSAEVIEEVQE